MEHPADNAASTAAWDHEVDVLIIGSGAGAMTAAVRATDHGLQVLMVEKTPLYGGTSAMSGGVIWLPASPVIASAGGEDSVEEALTYMKAVIADPAQEKRIESYVKTTPALTQFLAQSTPIRLSANPYYADMYPDAPGAKFQYRAHEVNPINGALLGAEVHKLRRQHPQTTLFGLIGWTPDEATILQTRGKGWRRTAFSLVVRYGLDVAWRLRTTRDRRLVLGGALVGGLRLAMRERGIPLWLESGVTQLVVQEGRVAGAVLQRGEKALRIHARQAVLLASGGFEKNQAMRKQYLPGPTDAQWTAGNPGNTGEMISAAVQAGAATWLMDEAWWGPTTVIAGEPQARMLIIEKNLPGSMIVNSQGRRFVNESSSYTKVTKGMLQANQGEARSVPAYFVFDAEYRRKYPCGPALPSPFMPDWALSPKVRGWLKKARSLEDLAGRLGVDAAGLVASAQQMNDYASAGKDAEFQRGDSFYDRMYGDQNVQPNPCLGPISKPPFYGVEIYPGDLGTKGGVKTDENGQVVDEAGNPIDGFYATGNCTGSVMGATYPASGSTLGPAMVFALRAADHIAQGKAAADQQD